MDMFGRANKFDRCVDEVRKTLDVLMETPEGRKFWGKLANHPLEQIPAYLDGASVICEIYDLDIPGIVELYNLYVEYENIFLNVLRRRDEVL